MAFKERRKHMNHARVGCPTCGQVVGQLKARVDWAVLPSGVRFDPSDEELLEHLLAKVGHVSSKEHPLINDFILTLDEEDGICRTHPENLPGMKKDGSACHYFYKPSMAYTTGTRKRRKIQTDGVQGGGSEVRWHKTGKTRPILQDGRVQGFKKIMVLYRTSGKKSKNMKTNWVMHQYHLGNHEEERDGEVVVCKVFLQKQSRTTPCDRKMHLLPIDEDGEDSEGDSEFQELPAPGLSIGSPSVSGVTREMPPTTPKLYARSRLQGKLSHPETTESISEISLAQSVDPPSRLAIQVKTHSAAVKSVTTPDCSFGGGNAIACKIPAGLASNETLNLVEPSAILAPTEQHMVDDSVVAGIISCGGEDESLEAVNLDEDHLPWEALNHEARMASVEDLNNCNERVVQLLCNETLNGAPLLQNQLFADCNWQKCAFDVGCIVEDPETDEVEVDPALHDIMLDTPPDMFEEVKNVVGKQKIVIDLDNSDSQSSHCRLKIPASNGLLVLLPKSSLEMEKWDSSLPGEMYTNEWLHGDLLDLDVASWHVNSNSHLIKEGLSFFKSWLHLLPCIGICYFCSF